MKITKEKLKEIILEEIQSEEEAAAFVSEAEGEIEGSAMEKHIQSLTKRVFALEQALKEMQGQ